MSSLGPDPTPTLRPGTVLAGRYRVVSRAGAGGMGTVYEAVDQSNGKTVALKLIDDAGLAKDRFAREAALLSELTHPGIVRYIDHGLAPMGGFYLVMEWVQGRSLAHLLDTEGLTAAESVELLRQVADAVAAAHQLGIVHRDLKPDNIMLEGHSAWRVRVIDFGIARRLREAHSLTRTGTMVGTPGYVAPEQARGDSQVDQRVDVFALGCVLYEALTGRAAYAGQSLMARLAKVLLGEPPTLEGRCPEAPPALTELLANMLALDPASRLRDAGAVAAGLAALGKIPDGPRRTCTVDDTPTRVNPSISRSGSVADREQHGEAQVLALVMVGAPDEEGGTMATMTADDAHRGRERLRAIAAATGARLELLADGSAIATLSGDVRATLKAAVRCAHTLRSELPEQAIALTIERRTAQGGLMSAIERGVESLSTASLRALFASSQGEAIPQDAIRVDAVAAQLLDGSPQLLRHGTDTYLVPTTDGQEE